MNRVTKHQNDLIHLDLHTTKSLDDVDDNLLDNTRLNKDHKMDMMLVLTMSYKNWMMMMIRVNQSDNFLLKYLVLDKLYDKMEVVNTYNKNLEDKLMEVHMVKDAFVIVAFVVDNDDDENDLVQSLVQLIHEYAKLN